MLSWKVWTTFVIVCISCVEYWHSNSCVSLTAVQLGLVVVGWSRSWSHEFNPDIKDLFLFCAYLFTSHTCWGLLFLLLANTYLFSSLIWSRFDSLRLLNACLWDSLVFQYFLIFLLAELCLPISELIVSSPSCHVSFIWAFLVCSLVDIFAIVSLLFVVLHWSIVNRAGSLLWITLLATKQSNYDL